MALSSHTTPRNKIAANLIYTIGQRVGLSEHGAYRKLIGSSHLDDPHDTVPHCDTVN